MSLIHYLQLHKKKIIQTNWVKTVWFNLTRLPLSQGVKMPFLISYYVKLDVPWGGVYLDAPSKFGMISLGHQDIPTQDRRRRRMILYIQKGCRIKFKGKARIGGGTEILLRNNSELVLGNNFYVSFNSRFYCYNRIEIQSDCTIGWNVLIMDTDWHNTYDCITETYNNKTEPIVIGNHCWICNDVQIQKGTVIPNNVIVAAKSLCNKKYDVPQYSLIAGIPAKLKKEKIGYVR